MTIKAFRPEGEQEIVQWRETISREVGNFPPSEVSPQEIEQWREEVSRELGLFPPKDNSQELGQWRDQVSRSI